MLRSTALVVWVCIGMQAFAADADLHAKGLQLFAQKDYAAAIQTLEGAAATEPHDSSQYRESALIIGQSYFLLSQAPRAIPWLEPLKNINEANYMLGYAYLQTSNREQSSAAFARLFGVDPGSAKAHLMAAQMMLKKGYEDQGELEARDALRLDANLPSTHFVLGEIAAYRGRLDEAISDFDGELRLNPDFAMAWYRRGDVRTRQEKWDEAIPDLQRAVWLNPDFSGPFILLGRCYFKTKNYSNAEGILRNALALDPNNAAAHYLLGQTLIASGQEQAGRAEMDKVRALKSAAPNSQ